MRIKQLLQVVLVSLGLILATNATAGKVTGGEFVMDLDEAALLGLDVEVVNVNWFDSEASANKTPQEMRETEPSDSVPDSFTFKVFGATIPSPPVGLEERAPQATTFEYEGDPTTGTGRIGLAGFHIISTQARHATSRNSGTPVALIRSPTQRMGDALNALRP